MVVNPNHKDQSHAPPPSNQVLDARTPPVIPESLSTLLHRLYPSGAGSCYSRALLVAGRLLAQRYCPGLSRAVCKQAASRAVPTPKEQPHHPILHPEERRALWPGRPFIHAVNTHLLGINSVPDPS